MLVDFFEHHLDCVLILRKVVDEHVIVSFVVRLRIINSLGLFFLGFRYLWLVRPFITVLVIKIIEIGRVSKVFILSF